MRRSVKNILRAGALCLVLLACALFTTALAEEGDVTYVKYSWDENTGLSSTPETLTEGQYTLVDSPRSLEKWGEDGEETWYVIQGTVNNTMSVVIYGDVNIILADGCDFTTPRVCVDPGDSLTIYGQEEGTGRLTSTGAVTSAGIGGMSSDAGDITIHGGIIDATGGKSSINCGAGIGGASSGDCGEVTIYNGAVTAKGIYHSAGIGGGYAGSGGEVSIYGGSVTAIGDGEGKGIGGGQPSAVSAVTHGSLTIKGDAFVIASSIGDKSSQESWNGVVFEGESGQVYGDVTLTDAEIPEGYTLTVPEGATLAVNGTLTNNGTLNISGDVTFLALNPDDDGVYHITDADGLRALADIVDGGYDFSGKTVVLDKDIDLGGESSQWNPIGSFGSDETNKLPFNGTFDGGGNTISGLYIDTKESFAGLFAYIGENGKVQNLAVSGTVNAHANSGGIAAYNYGTISNCYADVDVTIKLSYAGGVAGNSGGVVKNCYNLGNIQGNSCVAGIVGSRIGSSENFEIKNCYNIGKVSGNSEGSTGAILGYNNLEASPEVNGCYYLDGCVTNGNSYGEFLTAEEFADSGSFSSWDFINTWVMSTELGRPVLRSVPEGSEYLIDYVNEKATGLTVYEISTDQEWWSSGTSIPVTPGGTLYVRRVGSEDILETVKLPARPDAPALAINSATQSVTVDIGLEYSFDQTEWTSGTGAPVHVDAGDTIYIRYKASQEDGKFSSAIQALTAPGGAPAPGTPAIDYTGETVGTEAGMQYRLSETGPWTDCTADMPAADFGWDGTAPATVYFRADPGEPVALTIPARPAAPVVKGGTESIEGADPTMEYSSDGVKWTAFTEETLERMEPGEYQVRVAATESSFRSEAVTVTVAPGGQGVSVPETYGIELIAGEGGEAKTNLTNASAGTKITVTATPDEGYELAYITVDGERISGASFTMPAHDVTVRVYFTDAAAPVFVDVDSGDWFYDYVQYVARNGLMEGTGEGRFDPDGTMTRAMFWAVLARIDGETITGDGWKTLAQNWAVSSGISDGTSADALITREQMVTMFYRYAGSPVAGGMAISEFTDGAYVSDYATDAVAWALSEGVLTGMGDGLLSPQGTATRAQAAAMLMRFMER